MTRLLPFAVLLVFAVAVGGCQTTAPPGISRPLNVAVLPPASPLGDSALAWTAVGVQDALTWELRRQPDIDVAELRELVQKVGRPAIALAGLPLAELSKHAAELGLTILVAGAVEQRGDRLALDLRALDVDDQRVLTRMTFTASAAELPVALRRASADLVSAVRGAASTTTVPAGATSFTALATRGEGLARWTDMALGGGAEALRAAVVVLTRAAQGERGSAETWYWLGEALTRAARYDDAERALERAGTLARQAGHAALEAAALLQLGTVYVERGETSRAQPLYAEALALAQGAGYRRGEALALWELGTARHHRGEHEEAERLLQQSLAVWRALGRRGVEAALLNHLATFRIIDGQYDRARTEKTQALELARAVGDRSAARPTVNDLAVIDLRTGAYREAESGFVEALRLARELGDVRSEGLSLKNLGRVYSAKGDYAAARRHLEEALAKLRAGNVRVVEIDTLEALGTVEFLLREYVGARARYEEGLRLARAAGIALYEGMQLHHLGQVTLVMGEPDLAERHQEEALQIGRRLRARRLEALALRGLAEVGLVRRDYGPAARRFEEAGRIAETVGLAEVLWRARYGAGLIEEALGRDEQALARFREAVGVVSRLAGQFGEADERTGYLSDKLEVYDALVRVLLRLHDRDATRGHDREVWPVLDAKRGHVAIDALAGELPDFQDPELAKAVQRVLQRRAALTSLKVAVGQARAGAKDPREIDELVRSHKKGEQAFFDDLDALRRIDAEHARLLDEATRRLEPDALLKFADELPPQTLVVQYLPTPTGLRVFAVARHAEPVSLTVNVSHAEVKRLVEDYRTHLKRTAAHVQAEALRLGALPPPVPWADDGSALYRREVAPFKEVSARLGRYLLDTIGPMLDAHHNVVLLPNGPLFHLPIHALPRRAADGAVRVLAETHVVSYLTQQADLFGGPTSGDERTLVAVANPDGSLPFATEEVEQLGRIRKMQALVGAEATKEAFKTSIRQLYERRVPIDIHLATHGDFERGQPYLLMAGSDFGSQQLRFAEIRGLGLRTTRLAILSACETAVGEEVPGAGLITLAKGFSVAGSKSIVASLWRVYDPATRDFMVVFHRELRTKSPVAALHEAQLALLRNPATAHPFYWAPFILIGAR